jgi:mRNA interferase MazF
VTREYVPERGDFVWLDFDPQAGREQAGRRPALVLTPESYNAASRLAVVCPVTRQVKGYPFEVLVPTGQPVAGAVLSDHVRSLDWAERRATFIAAAPAGLVTLVARSAARLLGAV